MGLATQQELQSQHAEPHGHKAKGHAVDGHQPSVVAGTSMLASHTFGRLPQA